ncbi:MAG: TRAP transporter substrate-binding protein DctP [Rhodobacteraceae bacterium]|jgi:tripartite ATP-independent transporter DctP family solute receptor|nr:TRAP transporter substrate-binding protein DctP [Paracoccaceae bacterium]
MHILRSSALAAALALLAAAAQAQEIKVGLALPENLPGFDFVNGMYKLFRDEVEANSDMTVDLVFGGALGAPNERLAQMRRGVIQMSDAADGNFATIYPDIQVIQIPFLFDSEAEAWAVLDGPFGQAMAEDIRARTGIRVLGWWESGGFKHFSANRAIASPADMAGLKIRVLGPLATIPVEAMGASAAPVPFNELYTSLRTGVVDGQDNSVATFNLVKLYEVQSHMALTGHVYAFGPLGINDTFFAALPADRQQVILDAAATAIAFNRATSRATEAEALALARASGVTVAELAPEAKAAFRAVMQPAAIDWLRANIDTPAQIDAILAAVE